MTARRVKGGRGATVPDVEVRSYEDQPIIKRPAWTWEIPWYLFVGGLAGASSVSVVWARTGRHEELARFARRAGAVGAAIGPGLLVSDLGRPERFYNMLRVFRPTSPMNVGSWVLTAYGPAAVGAAVLDELGVSPRLQRLAEGVASVLGPVLATYTSVLVSDTAVPVWREAGRELPFVFAGGAVASAGAAATVALRPGEAGPARRMAVGGAVAELVATRAMEEDLGELAEPYRSGRPGRFARAAKALTAAGAAAVGLFGRRRAGAVAGGLMILAGAVCQRWAVFSAGFTSAEEPSYVLRSQR